MGLSSMFPPYPVASCARNESQEGLHFGASHTKKWLIDSGCGWDLVQECHVAHLEDLIRTPQFTPRMWTANGVTRAEHEVPLYISELDEHCVPFILKSTLDVLTMGRRCMEDGYSFVWKAKSNQPYFRKPDGTRIYLTVEHYVQNLTTNLVDVAAAAPES